MIKIKNLFIIFVLLLSLSVASLFSLSIAFADPGNFSWPSCNNCTDYMIVSGYVTHPDGTPINGTTAVLGTQNYTPLNIPANFCGVKNMLDGSNQTSTTTNESGYFELGKDLFIWSANSTCDLVLTITKNGFVTNETVITIDNATQYPIENRTLWSTLLNVTITSPIPITSPAGGSLTGPSAFLNATTHYDPADCTYRKDSETLYTPMNITGGIEHSQLLTNLTNGSHTAYVNCTNNVSSNWTEANVTWTVDAIGPTINLTTNDTVIAPGALINFTINDPSNVSAAWYSLNNGPNVTKIFSCSNQTEYYSIDTDGWPEGDYTIVVWANDTFGNVNDTTTQLGYNITIIINGTAPTLVVNVPKNDAWYDGVIMLNANATDDTGVTQVLFKWENSTDSGNGTLSLTNGTAKNGTWTYDFDASNLSEGSYNFTFTASDGIGNNDTKTVTNVSIDHTGPNVTIVEPIAMADISARSSFTVTANVTDTGSGIKLCKAFIDNPNRPVANLTYNVTTGQCSGRVGTPYLTGIHNLIVVGYDIAGNEGNDSININVIPAAPGGGGGGGLGGGFTSNETAEELQMSISVEPKSVDMLSNETAKLIVTITNEGKYPIQSLYPDITIFDSDEWSAVPPGRVNVDPGKTATLEITIAPKAHNSGKFTAEIKVGNARIEDSEPVEFTITNAESLKLAADARTKCDQARLYIVNLSTNGIDTKTLQINLTSASDAIDKSDFRTALDTCTAILAFVPGGAGGPTGGITGFFIGIGDFVVGNWLWLVIAAIVGLGLFVTRKQIRSGINKVKEFRFRKPKMPGFPKLFAKKTETKTGQVTPSEKKDEPEFEIGY